ncbi:MAG: hypothetical protein M3P91_02525 [Actinomycetota bacterium]|nr:hypothetical protein [Actinomycetota bacterium]
MTGASRATRPATDKWPPKDGWAARRIPSAAISVENLAMTSNDTTPHLVPLAEGEERTFDKVLRGYEPTQVDRHVAMLEGLLATIEERATVAESELETLRPQTVDLRRRVSELRAELERGRPTYEEIGGRIGQMLTLAEQEAVAIRRAAEKEAAEVRAHLKQEATAAEQRRVTREQESQRAATATVEKAGAEAQRMIASAKQTAERTVATAREEAQRTLSSAREQAASITQAAQRQVEQHERQRDAIRKDLDRVRERLMSAIGGSPDVIDVDTATPAGVGPAESGPAQAGPAQGGPAQGGLAHVGPAQGGPGKG